MAAMLAAAQGVQELKSTFPKFTAQHFYAVRSRLAAARRRVAAANVTAQSPETPQAAPPPEPVFSVSELGHALGLLRVCNGDVDHALQAVNTVHMLRQQ